MYINKPLKEYLDDLAAKKPAPGGGSAAALEASLGCALLSMVANFTLSNKRYAEFNAKASACLEGSEALRARLSALIDADVNAYAKLSEGFKKFDKDSRELSELCKEACDVPFEICKAAAKGLERSREIVEYGNKNLVTDTAIAALMLESAFLGAKFNVYINLKFIRDDGYIEAVHKTLSALEERATRLKKEVLHLSEEVIMK